MIGRFSLITNYYDIFPGAVLVLTESKNNKEEFIASMAKDVWTLSEQVGYVDIPLPVF